jgi:uncharacterized protein (TIGR00251 family)
MASWHRRTADGALVVCVHAQPGARRTAVAGLHGEALKIRVAAPALENRANDALIEFIAQRLGIAKRDVELVSGAKSREKRFAIRARAADPNRLLSEE